MDLNERIALITRNVADILGEERLRDLLLRKKRQITYCGYEVSGGIHLGHLVTITKLQDLAKAGFKVKVLFADWHTWLNQKGDWAFIRQEVKHWRQGFQAAGLEDAEFILGSTFQRKPEYIDDVMTLIVKTTIHRALRSMQQVARDIEHAKVSQVFYPFMQIVDIKHLGIDLVHSGIEQRKIHALGIELLPGIGYSAPIFVHTPLISSLKGEGKMSSSDPSSMISIQDSEEAVTDKIKGAFCLPGKPQGALFEILRLVIFPHHPILSIKRAPQHGGDLEVSSFPELGRLFLAKKIHPLDLKGAAAAALNDTL